MGYGAEFQVLFGKKWCVGKVVGGERGNVMVKYADGVGKHDDLHYRGCRIRTCRRQIDLDELYRNCPWMTCPFQEEQEECECWPCRSIKWPKRYAQWDLTEPEITEFESELPEKRETKNENRIADKIRKNRGGKRGRSSVADGQLGSDEEGGGGGGPSEEEDEEGERQNGPQTRARSRRGTFERRCADDRETEGRHSLDGDDGADSNQEVSERRHVPQTGTHGAVESEGACSDVAGTEGNGTQATQGRARTIGKHVAEGERGTGRRGVRDKTGVIEPTEERSEEADNEEGRSRRTHSNDNAAERKRKGNDAAETEQASEQGEVGQLGGGLSQVDGTTRVVDSGGGGGPECESTQHSTTPRGFKGHFPRGRAGRGETVQRGEKRSGDTTRVAR